MNLRQLLLETFNSLLRNKSTLKKLISILVACSVLAILIRCKPKESKFINHLAHASSPYLKEHADNPVDWYEWGEEALAKAKNEDKPLIISIGYASCHWCHVMEEESFMDTTVARIMNEHFVAIKIDREERPDIDQIYINAAQLITGNAGWPLNAFALPDGRPFYAATYFPKEQWINVLNQIAKTYRNDQSELTRRAAAVTEGVQSDEWIDLKIDKVQEFDRKSYSRIINNWYPSLDPESGGIKGRPKFPMPVMWEFLLQYHYLTGDPQALKVVQATLDEMSKGGINDQLAGGFARYSNDSMWQVPHFEKMLYDNAQLVSLYSHAYQLTKNPEYSNTIHQTLAFIEKELTSPEGAFYSSLNADSEGEEGKYYAWTKAELEKLLDQKSASLIVDYYNIEEEGNWEKGKNVLFREFSLEDFSNKYGMEAGECERILNDARKIMLEYRVKRIPPSRDDKIITSWNALMLSGYTSAFLATGKPEYLNAALKNAKFLREKMMQTDGKLFRIYKNGKPSIDAFLDDYAQLTKSFIHLYQATLDVQWLESSRVLTAYAIAHFYDQSIRLFYYTS
ncbi:MAG TPA: thioredoxin domain-containing protein, partial [Cyclobacteriaceae bacterium]|nr:thioredoxin domain-containing protein [Cyclobacteriaceae bacterium]